MRIHVTSPAVRPTGRVDTTLFFTPVESMIGGAAWAGWAGSASARVAANAAEFKSFMEISNDNDVSIEPVGSVGG